MSKSVLAELDAAIFERIARESERQGRTPGDVLGEAAERYLARNPKDAKPTGAVARTWGSMPLDQENFRELLEVEPDFLDA
ncbi:MAG TPA: hypothetical protein VN783_08210 [Thermoanaerobaculia bacterium]|nr:hypothetical protein [Thermoanaerobaculia bacterium]